MLGKRLFIITKIAKPAWRLSYHPGNLEGTGNRASPARPRYKVVIVVITTSQNKLHFCGFPIKLHKRSNKTRPQMFVIILPNVQHIQIKMLGE